MGAQAAHPQHVDLDCAIDPVAIQHTDQVIDAVHLDASRLMTTSPGSSPALAAGPSGSICASNAPILLSTPATTACRRGIGAVSA